MEKTDQEKKNLWLDAIRIAVISAIINYIVFWIGTVFGTINSSTPVPKERPLTLLPVTLASIIPVFAGVGIFALLRKFFSNPYRIFFVLSIIILIGSFVWPFLLPHETPDTRITLNIMHVVVVSVTLFFLRKYKEKKDH